MDIELEMQRDIIEGKEGWKLISQQIPPLHFKEEWDVRIIPPFAGAVARFYIAYNNKFVSVYLDWFDRLGMVGHPYYEIYDGEDTIRYAFNQSDKMMNDINKILDGSSINELYND